MSMFQPGPRPNPPRPPRPPMPMPEDDRQMRLMAFMRAMENMGAFNLEGMAGREPTNQKNLQSFINSRGGMPINNMDMFF